MNQQRTIIKADFRIRKDGVITLDATHTFRLTDEDLKDFDYKTKILEIYGLEGETLDEHEDIMTFQP